MKLPGTAPPLAITLDQGWGTYYRWRAANSITFILKLYLYLPMMQNDFS